MNKLFSRITLAIAFSTIAVQAQPAPATNSGLATKTTYVQLANNANALLIEPLTPNSKSRIGILVTHPDHNNNFNYFTGIALSKYGYRVMLLNYYGPEHSYYEFLQPIAAAIKAFRSTPGVEKVVLTGHSSGGAELTAYEDVAENGPAACQRPERIDKCNAKGLDNLPKADGMALLDANSGAPERLIALIPAVDIHDPLKRNPDLDLFHPKNGYDPFTKLANFSPEFLKRYFAAQGARANQIIDEMQARLAKIQAGAGNLKDDEPFVVYGAGKAMNGGRPELMDHQLMARTHAPHMLLKADGSKPVQIIPSTVPASAQPQQEETLANTTEDVTVREYLSNFALRTLPDYRMTEDNIYGVDWHSSADSIQGSIQGIRVPTLFLSGTCAPHLIFLEIAYDLSAAKDKTMVGVDGADHSFRPCKPEYGDTFKHAFDYVDGWLTEPGRF